MPHPVRVLPLLLVLVLAVVVGPATGRAAAAADPGGVWPLSPRPTVVRGFEPPSSPYAAGHRGLDLLGSAGQPVLAALPGRVTFAGQLAGRGVVVVDHGTTRTTYEPVTASVTAGDVVEAGGRIGLLTAALSHCRPRICLHLGWVEDRDDAYLDPRGLFGAAPVRLLPLEGRRAVAVAARVIALVSSAGMGLLVGPA